MTKPTRTYNPIHFEDLEPKRFEDLVRELVYDFRHWQTIEATGRGGDDQGFDVRAYERADEMDVDDDGTVTLHPMNGNLWMIQGKREREIGPKKILKILSDIDEANPPYGYILAASANFSKKAFDTFREELIKKGVMEFYLWGKPEMEAQLHLPKNDRILFTFFGISNVSRRRSRATEIRLGVANKNKLYRVLTDAPEHANILLRDSKEVNYPYESKYLDFEKQPRWREYSVVGHHPLGILVEVNKQYAFVDQGARTFDTVEDYSLIYRGSDSEEKKEEQRQVGTRARDAWERIPIRNQATYHMEGLVRYDEILVIDDKGDEKFKCPHLYVDFQGNLGPFSGVYEYLEIGHIQIPADDLEKVEYFPDTLPEPTFGTIHDNEPLKIESQFVERLNRFDSNFRVLYDLDGRFDHLAEGDVGFVERSSNERLYIQATHRYQAILAVLLEETPHLGWEIERQTGKKPEDADMINVIEFRPVYEWQFKPRT